MNREYEIFYHLAVMQSWHLSHDIINAHLQSSGILNHCRNIYYCINGDIVQTQLYLNLPHDPKFHMVHLREDAAHYEFTTLNFLLQRSKTENIDMLYVHSKGASQPIQCRNGHNNHLDNMCYNVISNYTQARQALADGYDAAGLAYYATPFPHFSGNCFWVRSEYVRYLSPLVYGTRNFNFYLDYPDRHDAEKWICSRPGQFYNMTHQYTASKYYGLTY